MITSSIPLVCVWVEEEQTECQTVEASCGDIISENVCKTKDSSSSGDCFWVVGKEPTESECVEKV
jgi:hypothetical protein